MKKKKKLYYVYILIINSIESQFLLESWVSALHTVFNGILYLDWKLKNMISTAGNLKFKKKDSVQSTLMSHSLKITL